MPKLGEHLAERLQVLRRRDGEPDQHYTAARVNIVNNRIYWHQVLRVNYTTYDRRRAQDSVNPRTHPDVLLLAPSSDTHKYWYARVIKIFHLNVHVGRGREPERLNVLFVRWFALDTTAPSGFQKKRLHRLAFVPSGSEDASAQAAEPEAFGFVDPADVVRGVHLIPAFVNGRTKDLLRPSLARGAVDKSLVPTEEDTDFCNHYVNLYVLYIATGSQGTNNELRCSFVDRDMFLRYYGDGIGHQGIRVASATVVADDDHPPEQEQLDVDMPEVAEEPVVEGDDDDEAMEDDPFVVEVELEDDLMRLVPELAAGMAEALRLEAQLRGDEHEGRGHGAGDGDSSDEESNDEIDVDEADSERRARSDVSVVSGLGGPTVDEEEALDEYEIDGFAPL